MSSLSSISTLNILGPISIPTSNNSLQQGHSSSTTSRALEDQKVGRIAQAYNTLHMASNLFENSLELPFKASKKNSDLTILESLDQSFIDHISNLSEDDHPFKPESGNNGTTRILERIVIKSEDLDALKRQATMSKILNHYQLKTPAIHLLGQTALNALSNRIPDFKTKFEEPSSDPVGAIVMAKVRGITFGEVITKGIKSFKNPNLRKNYTVFDSFCSQIDRRMQELGHLAALDMLMGNIDRLVRTRYSSEHSERQLQSQPMVNVGNWMYMTHEGSHEHTPGYLGKLVPIDNSCFDYPYVDDTDLEKSKKTNLDSFLNLMKQPKKIAEHILEGLKFNLFAEYQLDLTTPESVFGAGVTSEQLQINLEKGIREGIETIRSSLGDNEFYDKMINATQSSEQDRLIYSTIKDRVTKLKVIFEDCITILSVIKPISFDITVSSEAPVNKIQPPQTSLHSFYKQLVSGLPIGGIDSFNRIKQIYEKRKLRYPEYRYEDLETLIRLDEGNVDSSEDYHLLNQKIIIFCKEALKLDNTSREDSKNDQ